MPSANSISILAAVLLLQFAIARSDFLSPLLSPVIDDVCNKVQCGKGTCKPSKNTTFFYECQCDAGWKQTRSDHDDNFKFLPCVIPNCTMDYVCEAVAPSPVQEKTSKANASILDPCSWSDCGGGFCNKTSMFSYNCECKEGYYNLLNVSAFPCLRECSLGMDCANLGISISNTSSPPAPALGDKSQATSGLQVNLHWLMILIMSLAMVSWK